MNALFLRYISLWDELWWEQHGVCGATCTPGTQGICLISRLGSCCKGWGRRGRSEAGGGCQVQGTQQASHVLIRSYCRVSLCSVLKISLSKAALMCFATARCKLRHQMRHTQRKAGVISIYSIGHKRHRYCIPPLCCLSPCVLPNMFLLAPKAYNLLHNGLCMFRL